ncbi:hypothetical protein OEZ86_009011 [Tetradesmus obliquus]|nr:hypothetical protein OEZ86_009011 [Tetradesmus obliquus]
MSDSEMSDGDESAEEGEGADEAGVTAVCLDLKGMVFCTELLPLAGTAALVRINMPGPKSAKEATAHVEHLFDASFLRAAQQQQHAGEADSAAGFAFEDDASDAEGDCYAAALKASAAWAVEGEGQLDGQQQQMQASKRGKGGGGKGGRGGGKAGAGKSTTAAGGLGGGVGKKSRGGGKSSKAGSRSRKPGGRAAGKGAGAGGKRRPAAGKAAGAASSRAAAAGEACEGAGVGKGRGAAAAKKQQKVEAWEVSDGDNELSD